MPRTQKSKHCKNLYRECQSTCYFFFNSGSLPTNLQISLELKVLRRLVSAVSRCTCVVSVIMMYFVVSRWKMHAIQTKDNLALMKDWEGLHSTRNIGSLESSRKVHCKKVPFHQQYMMQTKIPFTCSAGCLLQHLFPNNSEYTRKMSSLL